MTDFEDVSELKYADAVIAKPPAYGMGMPDETVSPEPKVPFTEKQLMLDGQFAAAARDVHLLMEGTPFEGDNIAATKYGIDVMTEFNFNLAGPAGIPGESGISSPGMIGQAATLLTSGTEDQAKSFIYLMDQYDRLPMFTLNGTARAVRAMLGDASIYATIGAGVIGSRMTIEASKLGVRKALKEIAKRPVALGAAYTAAESGMTEKAIIEAERQAGYEVTPEEEALRLGLTTGIGGLLGAGLTGAGEIAAREAAPAIIRTIDEAGQAADARIEQGGVTLGTTGDIEGQIIDPLLSAAGKAVRGEEAPTLRKLDEKAPNVAGVPGKYTVSNDSFELDETIPKGRGFIAASLTPKNVDDQTAKLTQLEEEFPDPLSNQGQYAGMMSKTLNSKQIPAPPVWMIENANDMGKWSSWFSGLTKGQIDAASQGLSVQKKFKSAYEAGADAQLTGQLMLWSILSRRLSAFPHESGYKDLAVKAAPFIDKAARGEWSEADTAAWLNMVKETIPLDSPGRGATSNANAFGKEFLAKMSAVDANGVSALQRLHNMISDPNMSSKEIRRAYYGLAEGTGIKNKILSFALLVSGRNDVVVLDRIQINRMWAGGEKVYDDIMMQFDSSQGLAQYEALERSLLNRVGDLYAAVGRPEDASIGRYHWESWVLSSGQIVAHPTLESVVRAGGRLEDAPIGVPVAEGRFHNKLSGASYEKLPGGKSRYIYRTSDGTPYQFTKSELNDMLDKVLAKKSDIIPPDFPRTKAGKGSVETFEGGNKPWYEFEGVDRGKFDELIRQTGKEITE